MIGALPALLGVAASAPPQAATAAGEAEGRECGFAGLLGGPLPAQMPQAPRIEAGSAHPAPGAPVASDPPLMLALAAPGDVLPAPSAVATARHLARPLPQPGEGSELADEDDPLPGMAAPLPPLPWTGLDSLQDRSAMVPSPGRTLTVPALPVADQPVAPRAPPLAKAGEDGPQPARHLPFSGFVGTGGPGTALHGERAGSPLARIQQGPAATGAPPASSNSGLSSPLPTLAPLASAAMGAAGTVAGSTAFEAEPPFMATALAMAALSQSAESAGACDRELRSFLPAGPRVALEAIDDAPLPRLEPHAEAVAAALAPSSPPAPGAVAPLAAIRQPVLVADPGFVPELAARIRWQIEAGVSEARIELHPAELGAIALRVQLEGDQARVQIHAAEAATRQLLEQALPGLGARFGEAGLGYRGAQVLAWPASSGEGSTSEGSAAEARPLRRVLIGLVDAWA